MATITALKRQVKRARRVSVFVDGRFALGLSDAALLASGLAVGQELDDAALKRLRQTADDDKLLGNAFRFAALRPHSRWEIEQYLRRKRCPAPLAEEIMQTLVRNGLIDDAAFAASWMHHRRLQKPVSRRTLAYELRAKHVDRAAVEQALAADTSDDGHALASLIAKKRARYPDVQKLMRYLASQGFAYDDIKRALAQET